MKSQLGSASASRGAAMVMAAAPVAFAQWWQRSASGSELFEWNGRVDREVQVVMRGRQVWTNQIGRTEPADADARA